MNPLDARTPSELFGDEVADTASLRRAYAKLVRSFGPERNPVEFAHIRALYESALSSIKVRSTGDGPQKSAPRAAVVPAESAINLAAELSSVNETNLDAWLDNLWVRARTSLDPAALHAAVVLTQLRDPDSLVARLAASATSLPDHLVGFARELMDCRPERAGDPAWNELVASVPDRRAAIGLAFLAIDRAGRFARPERAWSTWEAIEGELGVLAPDEWPRAFWRTTRSAGWYAPSSRIAAWYERVSATDSPLPEETVSAAERELGVLECWQATGVAEGFSAEMARGLLNLEHPVRILAWQDLGSDAACLAKARAARGFSAPLAIALDAMTGRQAAIWAEPGQRGELSAARIAELRPEMEQLRTQFEHDGAAKMETRTRRLRLLRQFVGSACLMVGAPGLFFGSFLLTPGTGKEALLGGFAVLIGSAILLLSVDPGYVKFEPGKPPPPTPVDAARQSTRELVRMEVIALARREGLWLHQLASAAPLHPELDGVFDALLADPFSDAEVIGPLHVRNIVRRTAP